MKNPVTTFEKLEVALVEYLRPQDGFAGLRFFPGHDTIDVKALPRCVITCGEGGGDLAYAGIDQITAEILLLTRATESPDYAALARALGPYVTCIREYLCEDGLPALLVALNKPESGPDTREVKGFGVSGLEFVGQGEGRDETNNLMGVKLVYTGWCHLEE